MYGNRRNVAIQNIRDFSAPPRTGISPARSSISPRDSSDAPGGIDEVFGGCGRGLLAVADPNDERLRRGSNRPNFQTSPGKAIETFWNEAHTAARFDRRNQARGTIMFFRNQRRVVQRRE